MIVESTFKPAPWLRNAHLQTIYASEARRMPQLPLKLETLELPDGDFLELAWGPRTNGPLLVILHGVIGSTESKYARGLMQAMNRLGWQTVLLLFRGAGGKVNRLPRGYHSGDTEDFRYALADLRRRDPDRPVCATGFSMGGNVLLKFLGEEGDNASLEAAAAVSVPFDLDLCAHTMNRGLGKRYRKHIIGAMRDAAKTKFTQMQPPFKLPDLDSLKDFHAFDDAVTAPLHGFKGVDDYYQQASCGQYLHAIRRPTLIVHALDDPFMTPEVVPRENTLSDSIRLELSAKGGHVGFISGDRLGRPQYWLDQRLPEFLSATLEARS